MDSVDPFTIAAYRFVGIALPALSIVIYRNEDPFPRGKRMILIARSVMGASNLIIFFYGYNLTLSRDLSHLLYIQPEAHAHGGCEHDQRRLPHLGRHLRQDLPEGAPPGV